MNISIENEYDKGIFFDYERIAEEVSEAAVDYIKCPYECSVALTLVDNAEIHRMNNDYREIDRPTDVLSFPLIEYEKAGDFSMVEDDITLFDPDSGELMLGDIVISIDKVKEQAESYGHSEEREFAFLIAHSMLHLFGFDHMIDSERVEMEQKQEEILITTNYTRD